MHKCVAKILFITLSLFSFPSMSVELSIPEHLQKDFLCMARNLFFEARGEKGKGMIAVANVVINRAEHPKFPDSICGVIYEKNQFSWTRDPRKINAPLSKLDDKSKILAYEAVVNRSVKDITGGAVFFHANYTGFSWDTSKVQHTKTIGKHIFYKYRTVTDGNKENRRRL